MMNRIVPSILVVCILALLIHRWTRPTPAMEASPPNEPLPGDNSKPSPGRLLGARVQAPIDIEPPDTYPLTLPEADTLLEKYQHPALIRRLHDLICFHASPVAEEPAAGSIQDLAQSHGLRPDALPAAYRMAWLYSHVQTSQAHLDAARRAAAISMSTAMLERMAMDFNREHGPVEDDFFRELAEVHPNVPPPDCGAQSYTLTDNSIREWLDPASFPDFHLEEGWFDEHALEHIKKHNERLTEIANDPAFTTVEAGIVAGLLRRQSVDPGRFPQAFREAMDQIHTTQTLESLWRELTLEDDSQPNSGMDVVREVYRGRIEAFKLIANERWQMEWGISDPDFQEALSSIRLEIVPEPIESIPGGRAFMIRDREELPPEDIPGFDDLGLDPIPAQ